MLWEVLNYNKGDLLATPLHWASRAGHIEVVTLLYRKGSNLTLLDSQQYNALHLAVHAGQAMMIVYLLAIGIPVDSRDGMQRTPLMWSAYQGNSIQGMHEILSHNPMIDTVDVTGYTALHWGVISGHFEFVKCLLKAGASYSIKDPAGKTPRDWAVERGTDVLYDQILKECQTGISKKYENSTYSDVSYAH
jgi:palmitoyltransferase